MTREKESPGLGGGWLGILSGLGMVLAEPFRLMLASRLFVADLPQRPAILSLDDPTEPGYRTPPLNAATGETLGSDAAPAPPTNRTPRTSRALNSLDRLSHQVDQDSSLGQ
jgi:hypothetical protein